MTAVAEKLAAEEEFFTWIAEPDKWTLLTSNHAMRAGWQAFRSHMPEAQWNTLANEKIVLAVLNEVRLHLIRMHTTMLKAHGIELLKIEPSDDD